MIKLRLLLLTLLVCCGTIDRRAQSAEPNTTQPITPTAEIVLFNGQNLDGWETWLKKSGEADPDHIFRVEEGMLHASDGDNGYLATKRAYKNYHLSLEYKWGKKNPHDKYVRNSGVLLHGNGRHGAAGGVWMSSIECQLAQGCEGDLIVIRGKAADDQTEPVTISCETVLAADKKTRWQRGGKLVAYSGRQFWWSKHQPFFKELIDTRGKDDVASGLGEWTLVECICAEDRITIKINGEEVNEALNAHPTAGRILLQTEGHDVWFRKVVLKPLK